MLEPYVLKGTRTVLRRGGESNLSNLSDLILDTSALIYNLLINYIPSTYIIIVTITLF